MLETLWLPDMFEVGPYVQWWRQWMHACFDYGSCIIGRESFLHSSERSNEGNPKTPWLLGGVVREIRSLSFWIFWVFMKTFWIFLWWKIWAIVFHLDQNFRKYIFWLGLINFYHLQQVGYNVRNWRLRNENRRNIRALFNRTLWVGFLGLGGSR